jgi:hypothetical protein
LEHSLTSVSGLCLITLLTLLVLGHLTSTSSRGQDFFALLTNSVLWLFWRWNFTCCADTKTSGQCDLKTRHLGNMPLCRLPTYFLKIPKWSEIWSLYSTLSWNWCICSAAESVASSKQKGHMPGEARVLL